MCIRVDTGSSGLGGRGYSSRMILIIKQREVQPTRMYLVVGGGGGTIRYTSKSGSRCHVHLLCFWNRCKRIGKERYDQVFKFEEF